MFTTAAALQPTTEQVGSQERRRSEQQGTWCDVQVVRDDTLDLVLQRGLLLVERHGVAHVEVASSRLAGIVDAQRQAAPRAASEPCAGRQTLVSRDQRLVASRPVSGPPACAPGLHRGT